MEEAVRLAMETLASIRVCKAVPEETDLHEAIAQAFLDAGLPARHEAVIAPRCRIDFLCGEIGIEVKKGRVPSSRICAQCERYLASPLLKALIVVSPRALSLPDRIGGKPVYVCSLNRLWGVALP